MRTHFVFAILSGFALAAPLTPAAADWHSPHVYRESHGDWTNVEYNDGVCHYKYSHNAWDNETNVNRWGDCSRVVVGPGGNPMPVARVVVPAPGYGRVAPAPGYAAPGYAGDDGDDD